MVKNVYFPKIIDYESVPIDKPSHNILFDQRSSILVNKQMNNIKDGHLIVA